MSPKSPLSPRCPCQMPGGEQGCVIGEQLMKSQHPADLELPVPVPAPANLSEGGQKKKLKQKKKQSLEKPGAAN